MLIKFSKTFTKQRKKAPAKIQKELDKRIKLFVNKPHDPLLNLHKLKGVLKEYYSINISGDWRAILKISKNNNLVLFLILGTHSELYK